MFNFCFYDSDSKLFDLDTLFDFPVDFPRSDLVASVARALGKDPEERVIETLFSQFGADFTILAQEKSVTQRYVQSAQHFKH
jgi:hypothetical protein